MPVQFPDGVYDYTHTWQNENDRVAWERSISQDPVETAKILAALQTADPATPNIEIQLAMTSPVTAERDMVIDRTPIGVDDCFGGQLDSHVNDFSPSNFSGRKGEFSGTGLPSMPAW